MSSRHPSDPDRVDLPIPDAFAIVHASGRALACNDAFLAFAASKGVAPDLLPMLGSQGLDLLEEARRDGAARTYLSLSDASGDTRMLRIVATVDPVSGNIGVLLSDTTDEAASRQQLFQRNRELTVLNDIGRALSDTIDVDELCRRVFEQAEHILIARTFYIALWDRESNVIRFPLFVEEDLLRSESSRPFSNGLTEHLLVTGRPLMLSGNVHEEAAKLGLAPHGRPSLAWLGTPLIARGQPFGVIAVQDFDRADAYGPHDLELLTLIAAQAAAAIHSARLYAESRRAYDELTAAQERLLGAERLRSITETVGALNHEVNNPLASIAGNAQLLLKQSSLDAAARRKVEIVLDAARRIQAVTARMSSIIQATSMPYPGGTPILDVRRSVVAGDDSPPSAGEPVPGEAGTERLGSRKGGPARPDSTSKA